MVSHNLVRATCAKPIQESPLLGTRVRQVNVREHDTVAVEPLPGKRPVPFGSMNDHGRNHICTCIWIFLLSALLLHVEASRILE